MGVLIPDPKIDERPGTVAQELYKQWRVAKDVLEDKFVPENITFVHDPNWKEYWLSMTAAREQRHLVWKIAGLLYLLAQFSFALLWML